MATSGFEPSLSPTRVFAPLDWETQTGVRGDGGGSKEKEGELGRGAGRALAASRGPCGRGGSRLADELGYTAPAVPGPAAVLPAPSQRPHVEASPALPSHNAQLADLGGAKSWVVDSTACPLVEGQEGLGHQAGGEGSLLGRAARSSLPVQREAGA